MIYEVNKNLRKKLHPLYKNMNNTMILSCLQGHMGTAWTDDMENPTVAQIQVGIFEFFAGDSKSKEADELLNNLPEHSYVIVNTEEWKRRIEEVHEGRIEKFDRYAFERDLSNLDIEKIKAYLSKLPDGYELKAIDAAIAHDKSFQDLSEDFTSQYESIEDYVNKSIGFCITHENEVVSGATAYSIYDDGIEIEIETHPNHQRKGLAIVACAALILECIEKGKYPNWDAVSPESVKLAEKFGYVLDKPYDTYYVNNRK